MLIYTPIAVFCSENIHALLSAAGKALGVPTTDDDCSAQGFEDCASVLTEEEKTSDLESTQEGIHVGLFAGLRDDELYRANQPSSSAVPEPYVDALSMLIQSSRLPPPSPYVDALSVLVPSARDPSSTAKLEVGEAGTNGPVAMGCNDAHAAFPPFPPPVEQEGDLKSDGSLSVSESGSESESESDSDDNSSQFATPEQRQSPGHPTLESPSVPSGADSGDTGTPVQGGTSAAAVRAAVALGTPAHVPSPASIKRSVRRVESKLSIKSQNSPGNGASFSKPKSAH